MAPHPKPNAPTATCLRGSLTRAARPPAGARRTMVEGASASPPPRVGSPAKGSGAAAGFTFGVRSPTTGRESVKDDVYLHSSKRQEAGAVRARPPPLLHQRPCAPRSPALVNGAPFSHRFVRANGCSARRLPRRTLHVEICPAARPRRRWRRGTPTPQPADGTALRGAPAGAAPRALLADGASGPLSVPPARARCAPSAHDACAPPSGRLAAGATAHIPLTRTAPSVVAPHDDPRAAAAGARSPAPATTTWRRRGTAPRCPSRAGCSTRTRRTARPASRTTRTTAPPARASATPRSASAAARGRRWRASWALCPGRAPTARRTFARRRATRRRRRSRSRPACGCRTSAKTARGPSTRRRARGRAASASA